MQKTNREHVVAIRVGVCPKVKQSEESEACGTTEDVSTEVTDTGAGACHSCKLICSVLSQICLIGGEVARQAVITDDDEYHKMIMINIQKL